MNRITRWNPNNEFLSLRDAMDRLLAESFVRPFGVLSAFNGGSAAAMPLDLVENDNEFVVKASVPGLQPEQIAVHLENDLLTIRGEYQNESESGTGQTGVVHYREQQWSSVERSIRLPSSVNADACRADLENGILTLTLPKAEHAKSKTIQVQPGKPQLEQTK